MELKWCGQKIGENEFFDASVPGNIQNDYAIFKKWGDINYGDNCKKYLQIKDDEWFYKTSFNIDVLEDEKAYFVSNGIDYEYDIFNEEINVSINIGGNIYNILDWKIEFVEKNTNLCGHIIQFILPKIKGVEHFCLNLESKNIGANSYKLHYKYKSNAAVPETPILNM